MARTSKYDWPDDEKLQALLDEHGTTETARQLGCPPSSLSNRIRQRGLKGSKARRTQDAEKPTGEPVRERVGAALDKRSSGNGSGRASVKATSDQPNQIRQRLEDLRESVHRIAEESEGGARIDRPPFIPPVGEKIGAESASSMESSSNRRRVHPVRRLGRLLRRVPPPIWWVLAVLGLTATAGLAAFLAVSNDPKTYEREASFAVRPSETVPPAALSDVLGTLAQPDSAVTETIVDMLGSARLRSYAAQSADLPASSVADSGTPYIWSASRRPGSTIIDVRLTGPNDAKLLAMQAAAAPEAARLVEANYTPYRLESLSAPEPIKQVGPQVARTVGLALLLGALLGITLVLLERKLRSSLGTGTLDRGRDGPRMGTRSQWRDERDYPAVPPNREISNRER
jgi:hypothetical protein